MATSSILTNTAALRGTNNLNQVHKNQNTNFANLSSGHKINSAKDDAAGLMISDRLMSQLEGYNQAVRNASDSIAYYQTADFALSGTTDALMNMRNLATQAANGTLSDADRQSLQNEFNQNVQEINHIAEDTTFNGQTMLDGNSSMTSQVGPDAGNTISSAMIDGYNSQSLISVAQNGDSRGQTYGGPFTATVTSESDGSGGTYASLSIATQSDAESALSAIDSMINYVDSGRAELGSMSNRLESSISNSSNISTNLADANSRIRDTDYAAEVSDLVKNRILEKASVAMHTQANANQANVFSLLN